ncbi:glutamine--fructose-6-phosphate aminotransferase [Candidatus Nomurabacteria bacterium RIFCSPLOWO2_01_FULL_41_12]|uniref:Glutamine--fructose-6-phosphate aminotransferase [isomerizing] n=1 Tax=Candidatus Nomurabacteria bacterium RIFCSPLOWO2_01_FULL_41_12 TaxID=1801774 RepID=A0A1F6WVA5_9BACT|nr:MAG: glutamine--fructose-6-phosphate aminotransferase [Candidatus Nomurabacteria bacterium RIFCSPHIGHO2_01_FULL_40_10]OGI85811.1 MAG: glutamine--fructose-6-phosphate aminotransferase [Candidatus Nomurabacteria bacterium RIFCSPLOWO2_01_FULL_41_12]
MCGIVGYIGKKEALPILLGGLRDLEYRGYDSAGIAVLDDGKIKRIREIGKVDFLVKKIGQQVIKGNLGIAHTRWATHGGVTVPNAHPHTAGEGKLMLVHNGIIENYRELKKELKDQNFESETDSEILAKLIYQNYDAKDKDSLLKAVKKTLPQVRGTYGLLVMHADHPDELVAARLGSPLVIGIGNDENKREYYIASDVTPILPFTKQVTFLDDGEVADIDLAGLKIFNIKDELIAKGITKIEWDKEKAQKNGYENFMLKEIFDQPAVFEDAIRGRINMKEGTAVLGGLAMTPEEMRNIKRIVIVACGTASYAGMIGKYAFERLADIPTEVDISSEFRYRDPVINEKTLVFALSQSGETLDTLMAVREAKRKGATVRSIVNVVGSTIAREAGAGTYIHAGPEIAVASTKAFTNTVAVLLLYALEFGRLRHVTLATGERLLSGLLEIPGKMNRILAEASKIKIIAEKYKNYPNFFFLGRGINYPMAMEGSLKLKETSYIHSEAYPAGEMKHGAIALLSPDFPVLAIMTKNQLYEKMKSGVQEVRARKSKVIVIATEGDEEAKEMADDIIYVPKTMELLEPLLNTIPLQLFAYYVAVGLGRDIDRPRNLAKSVTVE